MSAVQVNASNQMDRSCNWRCCFGCKDQVEETPAPAPTPAPIVRSQASTELHGTAARTDEAAARLRRQVAMHEVADGALDVEFDAVHLKIRHTPETSEAVTDE